MLGILAGASVVSGVIGARSSRKAAGAASASQTAAAELGIEEQRRNFAEIKQLLAPYSAAGQQAIGAQGALAGLGGNDAMAAAVNQIQMGPQFQALAQQGENAILQNASATGGLRGGNTNAALARFRPELLSQLIEQQYQRLGGIAGQGLQAGGLLANAGTGAANAVTQLRDNQGAAQAGNALARGNVSNKLIGGIGRTLGRYAGLSTDVLNDFKIF